jgi:predicted anti-sigma-YlaC factor YlaD
MVFMKCTQIQEWMLESLDGVLSDSNQGQLMAHLETCPDCHEDWVALNALEQVFARPAMMAPAPGFAERVEARLDHFEAQRRTLLGGLILLGAAMALCLIAVPSLLNGRNPLEAYGVFLQNVYALLGYVALLSYKLLAALWLILDALAESADTSAMNLLTYAVGAVLAALAWRRSLLAQRGAAQTMRQGR